MDSKIHKERAIERKTHEAFTKRHGGEVFYVFSAKSGNRKVIQNPEVIEQIRGEIKRLRDADGG